MKNLSHFYHTRMLSLLKHRCLSRSCCMDEHFHRQNAELPTIWSSNHARWIWFQHEICHSAGQSPYHSATAGLSALHIRCLPPKSCLPIAGFWASNDGSFCKALITHSVGGRWVCLTISRPLNSSKCTLWTCLVSIFAHYKCSVGNEVQKNFSKTTKHKHIVYKSPFSCALEDTLLWSL